VPSASFCTGVAGLRKARSMGGDALEQAASGPLCICVSQHHCLVCPFCFQHLLLVGKSGPLQSTSFGSVLKRTNGSINFTSNMIRHQLDLLQFAFIGQSSLPTMGLKHSHCAQDSQEILMQSRVLDTLMPLKESKTPLQAKEQCNQQDCQ